MHSIWPTFGRSFGLLTLFLAAQGVYAQNTLTCSSDDGRRHYCNVDTQGGVQLVRQRSDSPCRQGSTWGWDGNGVWVDRGCRADFQVGRNSGGGGNGGGWWNRPGGGGQTITCSSENGSRNNCNVDTRGGVRLVRQRSDAPCQQGSTWGWDGNGIWVDRGCRADFQVGNGGNNGGGWNGGGGNSGSTQTIRCASDDGRRRYCDVANITFAGVSSQLSDARCRQGSTWGWDQRGVWVDKGCRAEFTVRTGGNGGNGGGWWNRPGGGGQTISCSSDDGSRHYCNVDTRGGVQLVRQRSDSPCQQGSTWGWDGNGIWVDRGCRADFQVGSRGR